MLSLFPNGIFDLHAESLYIWGGVFLEFDDVDKKHMKEGRMDDSLNYIILISQIAENWFIRMRDVNDAYVLISNGNLDWEYIIHNIHKYNLDGLHQSLFTHVRSIYNMFPNLPQIDTHHSIFSWMFTTFCFGRPNRLFALAVQFKFLFKNYRKQRGTISSLKLTVWNMMNYLFFLRAYPKVGKIGIQKDGCSISVLETSCFDGTSPLESNSSWIEIPYGDKYENIKV